MNLDSILSALYGALAVLGLVLLFAATAAGDIIGVVVGMGALMLGVLGLEAQAIFKKVVKSREVK